MLLRNAMAQNSKIEWTQSTWNPVTGCTKVSVGCRNCYAERMALRLMAAGSPNYANGFRVTVHPHALDVMRQASQHQFQVLTKRSERLLHLSSKLRWPENVWMGVTVETADYLCRIDHLRQTPAAVKFISFEPLLGRIPDLDLTGIDWVIVGGESGPGARLMKQQWAVEIRDKCLNAGTAFFFKQWGGVNKKRNGRSLEGRTWDDMPLPERQTVMMDRNG
jgi:protein gp37